MGVGDASCFADTARSQKFNLCIPQVYGILFFHDVTLSALKICLPKNGIHPAKSV
ncbi:hypothetical protein [Fischerella thermalis]|uniref:hypothetical protein n=1 Tax=Fischerella thermalis TaxID=372787 RepID=UPI0015E127B4|nr:hypothetical protein [Fischerella thermalis]